MFLYPYPHPVHFQEGSTWTPENRLAFPPTEHQNGRPNNSKGGLMELGQSGLQPTLPHQPPLPPGAMPPHHFQAPDCEDQKPQLGQFSDLASIASYSIKEKCRNCGEEVIQADLIQHMRNHMGPRRCEICNYEAPTKHHLREHLNVHTGAKPYLCQFCSKAFAAKNSLRVHTMYLHTKIRAHQCHFCDQRFVTTSERKSHELVHTDKCPVCQMTFRLRGHLRQHMRCHANSAFHHKKQTLKTGTGPGPSLAPPLLEPKLEDQPMQ